MIYTQKTYKSFRPTIDHPVGKYFISFYPYPGKPVLEFLLKKSKDDGWLTSGFPTLSSVIVRDGKETIRSEMNIWYFDDKESVIKRLTALAPGWREAQNAYVVTSKGFRLVKRGEDIK